MPQVFRFATAPDQYRAEACAISCFDARFELAIRKFLKRRGAVPADHVRVAGSVKGLAAPRDEAERAFLLDQVRASIRLHATTRAMLFAHSDCGAYGGLQAFGGDAAREEEHHRADLARAARVLRAAIPDLAVESFFVRFDGVWEVSHECASIS